MHLKPILVTLLLLAMLFSACAPANPGLPQSEIEEPTRESSALTPLTPTPTVEDAAQDETILPQKGKEEDAADGRFIVYQRAGGIAGIDEEWIIYGDGTVVGPDGAEKQVNPEQVQEMVDMGANMRVPDPDPLLNPCCDRITYTLTFYVDGETKMITTTDGAERSAEVTAVFNELSRLLGVPQP